MLTVMLLLVIAAFICALLNATGKFAVPLWVSVILLCIIELIHVLPLR
jgi:hypothetical protein